MKNSASIPQTLCRNSLHEFRAIFFNTILNEMQDQYYHISDFIYKTSQWAKRYFEVLDTAFRAFLVLEHLSKLPLRQFSQNRISFSRT